MRVLEIKKFLKNVISYGYEQKEEHLFFEHEASSENTVPLQVIMIYNAL